MPKVLPEYRSIARSRILEVARTMFRENGFRQTTMDEMARELGISKAALYTYFKDKEELFKAVYESSPRELEKMIGQALSQHDSQEMFSCFFDDLMPESGKSAAMDFEVISEAARNPELRKVLKKFYDDYTEAVLRCVEAMGKPNGPDSAKLAASITALWYGVESMIALGYPKAEVKNIWNAAMEKLLST